MILYLHGFRSSPASSKARRLGERMTALGLAKRFVCPQLPVSPRATIALVESFLAAAETPVTLVGSSLGGCYATYLTEKHGCKAVLVNPAVVAHLSLRDFVGVHTHLYTDETFEFTLDHLEELVALDVARITRPELFWLLVETGDEVLDYRAAVARYAGARQTVIEGGDHSFQHWDSYLDEIVRFASLG